MKRRSNKITLYNNVYSVHSPNKPPPKSLSTSLGTSGDLFMYRYTFGSRVTIVAALLLCVSLLLQPVGSAYAQEEEAVPMSEPVIGSQEVLIIEETEEAEESVMAEINNVVVDEEDIVDDAAEQIDSSFEEEEFDAVVETNVASTTEADLDTDEIGSESSNTVATSTAEDNSEVESDEGIEPVFTATSSTSTTPLDTPTSTGQETSDVVDSSENNGDEGDIEQTASSTGEVIEISIVESDQSLAFNKNECTEVDGGSFYCQKITGQDQLEDGVFAAPDRTGDMEIYVVQGGSEIQLTENKVEDASPYYDARSETFVWHRLINDRYQIVSYDIDSATESVLTDTRVNNMEPARSGDYTVWQRWIENNWEIVLHDGDEEIQLTDTVNHDLAPHIHGDMIIWNVRSSDGTQTLKTYDIGSERFNTISDTEGVSVMNPRMLVMYEAQYQNGDTVMKGFDLVTGEIIPIERLPRELPAEIPNPDATGEVRALPNNSNVEEDVDPSTEPDPVDPPTPLGITGTSTATSSTEIADLDLRELTNEAVATTTDVEIVQATIPDVIIPAFEETSTSSATSTQ